MKPKTYSKRQVAALMAAHYPRCTNSYEYRWYCKCGKYIDYERCFPDHIKDVLRRNPGDTK